jgi:cell division septation protein DedD
VNQFGEDARMEELHAAADDQSHYEISLTAGQAFVAFVLLLLSLAAAFAFGLMIGKGQADERLVVRKETPVVSEAGLMPKKSDGKIVELGVANEDFADTATDTVAPATTPTVAPVAEDAAVAPTDTAPAMTATAEAAVATPVPAVAQPAPTPAPAHVAAYAQLLSTGDQKTAESLAARLIDHGFTAAYVERGATDKGLVYRVRVKFDSESDARAAETKLKAYSKEVWITTK